MIAVKATGVHLVNSTVSDAFIPDVDEGVVTADAGATVWLQGTSVRNNKAVLPLMAKADITDGGGVFFSDRDDVWFSWNTGAQHEIEQHEASQVPSDTSEFLSGNDEWFVSVLKVCVPATAMMSALDNLLVCVKGDVTENA